MPLRSISPGAWLLGHFRRDDGGGDCVMVVNDDPSSTAFPSLDLSAGAHLVSPHCVVAHFPDRTRITTCCCAHCRGARGEPGDGGARGGGGAQRCARRGGVPPVLCGGQRAAVLLEQLDSVGVKTHGDSYHQKNLQNMICQDKAKKQKRADSDVPRALAKVASWVTLLPIPGELPETFVQGSHSMPTSETGSQGQPAAREDPYFKCEDRIRVALGEQLPACSGKTAAPLWYQRTREGGLVPLSCPLPQCLPPCSRSCAIS